MQQPEFTAFREFKLFVFWNRFNGHYQVVYSDNEISQPFAYNVACDYAEMFGGVVVPAKNEKAK